jgi:hypothetical protein
MPIAAGDLWLWGRCGGSPVMRAKRQQARLRLAVADRGHLRQGFTFLKARLNQAYRGR